MNILSNIMAEKRYVVLEEAISEPYLFLGWRRTQGRKISARRKIHPKDSVSL